MKRTLLAIGCNRYDHLNLLAGAEHDATRIFEALLPPDVGDYDPETSRLLLSPTLAEVRAALDSVLFAGGSADTLTLFFAGHGAVGFGSFYMAVRETRPDALSSTGFALGELFRMIAEAAPAQAYVIIDACESGGLIEDLGVILKADVLGRAGTPGITLLAMAASDQTALENAAGGFGTTALLECVRGGRFVQDSGSALDLVEIGRVVSQEVGDAGGQTPVVWGLNLYGPPSFCKNPHARTGDRPLRSVLAAWPDRASQQPIRAALPTLWETYATLAAKWDARLFVSRLAPILDGLADRPAVQCMFADRIAEAFSVQAVLSEDRFRDIEMRAACCAALLRYADGPEINQHLLMVSTKIADVVDEAIADVIAAIDIDRFALLHAGGGLAELYQLPIRITKLIGWAAYSAHARGEGTTGALRSAAQFEALLERLVAHYSLSLVAMNDSQAPFVATAMTAIAALGLTDLGEQLFGYFYTSCISCGGRVARISIEPEQILGYLMARDTGVLGERLALVAQPSEFLAVLLRSARLLGLDEEADVALADLDHLSINGYLPGDYRHFAELRIDGGQNATYRIGHEIWTVGDLEADWPVATPPASRGMALASILSTLLFPDRTPWFLYHSCEQ